MQNSDVKQAITQASTQMQTVARAKRELEASLESVTGMDAGVEEASLRKASEPSKKDEW